MRPNGAAVETTHAKIQGIAAAMSDDLEKVLL